VCDVLESDMVTNSQIQVTQPLLRPFLPRLTPLLLSKMCYSELELSLLDAQDNDQDVEDRDEDLRPTHHRSRNDGASTGGNDDDGHDDDGDDDDDYEGDADPLGWTIRKVGVSFLSIFIYFYFFKKKMV
jgi:transportin-1